MFALQIKEESVQSKTVHLCFQSLANQVILLIYFPQRSLGNSWRSFIHTTLKNNQMPTQQNHANQLPLILLATIKWILRFSFYVFVTNVPGFFFFFEVSRKGANSANFKERCSSIMRWLALKKMFLISLCESICHRLNHYKAPIVPAQIELARAVSVLIT